MGQALLLCPWGAEQVEKTRPGKGIVPGGADESCCLHLLFRACGAPGSSRLHSEVSALPGAPRPSMPNKRAQENT